MCMYSAYEKMEGEVAAAEREQREVLGDMNRVAAHTAGVLGLVSERRLHMLTMKGSRLPLAAKYSIK